MKRTLIVVLVLACINASAAIYRWVDADGHPQYSDRPAPSAEQLKPASTAEPTDRGQSGPTTNDDVPRLGPYKEFEIVAPRSGETLRRDDGTLPVSLLLDPPLLAGHRLELVVDGATVPIDQAATQLTLTGIAFGSHSALARILGPEGDMLARTAPVSFHLRQPIPPGVLQ